MDAGAPQPSDEALETVAEISGDLMAPVGSDEGDEEAAREGSDGRRRGRGSWRRRNRSRSGTETVEYAGDWRKSEEAAEGGDSLVEPLAEAPFAPLPEWRPRDRDGKRSRRAGAGERRRFVSAEAPAPAAIARKRRPSPRPSNSWPLSFKHTNPRKRPNPCKRPSLRPNPRPWRRRPGSLTCR